MRATIEPFVNRNRTEGLCLAIRGLLFASLSVVLLGTGEGGAAEIIDLRIGIHDGFVRLVIELDAPADYSLRRMQNGSGIVVKVDADSAPIRRKSPAPPVGDIRVAPAEGGSKVEIKLLRSGVRLKEMVLVKPPRVVLDFSAATSPSRTDQPPPKASPPPPPPVPPSPSPAPEKSEGIVWPTKRTEQPARKEAPQAQDQTAEEIPFSGAAIPGRDASQADFDHFRTRFPLSGGHERVSCQKCHIAGMFQGTPTRCAICHDGSGVRSDSGKGVRHIRSTDQCGDCHLQVAWTPSRIDHAAVIGGCADCHNGITAPGKHPGHIQSSNRCEDCHRTMTWFAAHFNHVNVTASCFSCHNGSTATGKGAQHVQSSNACENCHSPGSWQNAHFNHVNVTASCFSCHNGSTATGKGAQHIQSSNTCEDCHSPGSWLNVRFDHAQVMGDCGSCHASDFKMDAHKKVDSPTIFYTATELRDCTGACHFYTDSSFTTILERRSGEHGIPPAEW